MLRQFSFTFLLFTFGLCLRAQSPEVVVQTGHSSQIFALAYSADGKILLSASSDNTCNLWDVSTGMCFRSIPGNGELITAAALSPDGTKMAIASTGDREVNVQVYEVLSGKRLHSLRHAPAETDAAKRLVDAMDFSPAGDLLATKSETSILLWDMTTGGLTRTIDMKKTAVNTLKNYTNSVVRFLDGGRLIAGEESPAGIMTPNITVWNVATGEKDHTVDVTGKNVMTETKKGVNTLLNKVQNPGSISIPSINKPSARDLKDANPFHWYVISPDGNKMGYLEGGREKITLSLYDMTGAGGGQIDLGSGYGKLIDQIMQKSSAGDKSRFNFPVAFSQDGKYIAVGIATLVRIFDTATLQPVKTFSYAISPRNIFDPAQSDEKLITAKFEGYSALAFHPGNTFLSGGGGSLTEGNAAGSTQVITSWNLQTGREVIRYEGYSGKTDYVGFTQAGDGLLSFGTHDLYWNLSTGNLNLLSKTKGGQWTRTGGGKTDTVQVYGPGFSGPGFDQRPVAKSSDGQWELRGGRSLTLTNLSTGTITKKTDESSEWFVPGFRNNQPVAARISSAEMKLTDVNTGNELATFTVPAALALDEAGKNFQLTFDPEGKYLSISKTRYHDDIYVWNTATGQLIGQLKGHTRSISSVAFSPGQRMMATASGDAEILLWELPACKPLATFIAVDSADFIITTPDNYYLATKNALGKVAFRMDTRAYPFEQFDLRYNRPDIVLTRLGTSSPQLITAYHKAWLKRLKKTGFTEAAVTGALQMPEVKITTTLPLNTTARNLSFTVEASDPAVTLNRLNVWVNDVPLYGMNGKGLTANASSTFSGQVDLELSAGMNKIQVSVMNSKGAESIKETHLVKYEGVVNKPDLYLITIGVSEYKDTRFNLRYASKDARDVSSLLAGHTELYGQVYSKQLLDAQVTAADVKAIKSFFANARVDDVVIIFVAGHGLLDTELNYYYATHNISFTAPAAMGLPYEALEALLDGIAPRKKVLFMDTCHSGELDKDEVTKGGSAAPPGETGAVTFRAVGAGLTKKNVGLENSFELMQALFADLRRGTGATVISSAGGAEFAMEGEQWNNGVFTWSLLTGMRDQKADLNGDGKIMLSELEAYVRKQVSEVTGGKQAPTSRMENLSGDVRIW